MRYLSLLIIFVVSFFMLPFTAYPKGMSELDIGGFEKKKDLGQIGAAKSPFTPARPSPQDLLAEDLFLTGIAIGTGRSYALISGHILTEGDKIAGLRVRSISRGKVVLQHLDRVQTLYLEGGL